MPAAVTANDLLTCAIAAARRAGEHALNNLDRRQDANSISHHDVKLKLDVECQEIAESVIRNAFPNHDILGEEDDHAGAPPPADDDSERLWPQPSDNYLWVIDPIDGTVNFSHGLPYWCCSVGVMRDGTPLAGAVYVPALGELYAATCDTPATCNDVPIHVSSIAALEEAIVLAGVDRHEGGEVPPFSLFNAIAMHAQRPRVMGSSAVDLCNVAAGRAEGYIETGIFLWDVAAASLIVRQAGGRAEALRRENGFRLEFIATNGHIHEELKAVMMEALGRGYAYSNAALEMSASSPSPSGSPSPP